MDHAPEQSLSTLVKETVAPYPRQRDALVSILSALNDRLGYLPPNALDEVSQYLTLPPSEVQGVASFYRMFSLTPHGTHRVQWCESPPCHISGGCAVGRALRAALALDGSDHTPDGQWSFEAISCVGHCNEGPVVIVDGDYHHLVSADQVGELLGRYREEGS